MLPIQFARRQQLLAFNAIPYQGNTLCITLMFSGVTWYLRGAWKACHETADACL